MSKFIAIRKAPRTEMFGLARLSTPERRIELVHDALGSTRSGRLRGIGLQESYAHQPLPAVEIEVESSGDVVELPAFQRLGHIGAYVVETPDDAQAHEAREILQDDYEIVPDIPLTLPSATLGKPSSRRPRRDRLWTEQSGVPAAHEDGNRGEGVLVGVLDTGCDADHREFDKRRIEYRYVPLNPAPDRLRAVRGFAVGHHGTHVCGIIAGEHVGIAPDVELMVAAVIESESVRTSLERVALALDWMLSQFERPENATKPTIINLSLGFRPEWVEPASLRAAVVGVQLILSTLVVDFNVLPIVAIGNDGPGNIRMPATYPESLAVGAVDYQHEPASFSGGGVSPFTGQPKPDIAGYGVQVPSSLERDIDKHSWYAPSDGTSMAAPYVTGIAALYASADPSLQGPALRQRLIDTSLPLPYPADRVGVGLARYVT